MILVMRDNSQKRLRGKNKQKEKAKTEWGSRRKEDGREGPVRERGVREKKEKEEGGKSSKLTTAFTGIESCLSTHHKKKQNKKIGGVGEGGEVMNNRELGRASREKKRNKDQNSGAIGSGTKRERKRGQSR